MTVWQHFRSLWINALFWLMHIKVKNAQCHSFTRLRCLRALATLWLKDGRGASSFASFKAWRQNPRYFKAWRENPRLHDHYFHIEHELKWLAVPPAERQKFIDRNLHRCAWDLTALVVEAREEAQANAFNPFVNALGSVQPACCRVPDDDIELQMVGSIPRMTAAFDCDMDLQVKRGPKSQCKDKPFTETDKHKVAKSLEGLFVVSGPVEIGNVSIKFVLCNRVSVDLVLWKPRLEQFPMLRGGKDFYEKLCSHQPIFGADTCRRCHHLPPAAWTWNWMEVERNQLLEAMIWRLSIAFPWLTPNESRWLSPWTGRCSESDSEPNGQLEVSIVLKQLNNWEQSPFGSDLQQDLDRNGRNISRELTAFVRGLILIEKTWPILSWEEASFTEQKSNGLHRKDLLNFIMPENLRSSFPTLPATGLPISDVVLTAWSIWHLINCCEIDAGHN